MTIYVNGNKVCISKKIKGQGIGIPREVRNGTYQPSATSFTFIMSDNAHDLGNYALKYAFYQCNGLVSADLSSLTDANGSECMNNAFNQCVNLVSVDLSGLTAINKYLSFASAFYYCSSLTSIDLSSLTTISGSAAMSLCFAHCQSLAEVDFSNLTTISSQAFSESSYSSAFRACTSLQTVRFPKLVNLSTSQALIYLFGDNYQGCSIKDVYFNSLNSSSFGRSTSQFYRMLYNCTGCTVHFPSNLQSVIGSWSDVTNGFGGTNTTVSFDLPATS